MTTTSEATTKDTQQLLVANLNIVANAIQNKTKVGRGASNKLNLYGIKKIRQLILDLAVRGLLVPQDNNDEPASVLLEKIATEKAELIKQGKIKKQKPLPVISEDEKSFIIPDNWQWVRLGVVGETNIGLTYKPENISKVGIPVLRSSNIQQGKMCLSNLVRVSNIKIKNSSFVENGDLLICARNGSKNLVGKTAMINNINEQMAFGAFMAIYRSSINSFIKIFLNSPVFRKNLEGIETTTINQITQNNLKSTIFALPPLAEQQRIVAKVDELMALCDQLEQQQQDSITIHNTLVTTLLNALTNANNKQEFNNTWTTITDNFALLFTTEQSIDELKQCILQLAVMGKLVPQDASDEPASVLLEKIATEKAELIKQGKIKKQKPLPAISDDEKPFAIPDSWQWVRLGCVYELDYGKNLPKNKRNNSGKYPVYGSNGIVGYHDKYCIKNTCIIVGRKGSAGALQLNLSKGCWVTDVAYSIEPSTHLNLNFVFKQLQSLSLDKLGKGIKPGLNRNEAYNLLIALPSLAEQQRIVAKVDELMAICDNLKQALAESQQLQLNLADATVEHIF